MTTAFAYAAKGQFLASFAAQPMGCILALLTGMAFVGSIWTLVTGRTIWPVYERLWAYKAALMRGWME
jgi:hypothetical protein